MGAVAFQDLMVHNQCWGCGPSNEHGLRVKSRWSDDGEESVCRWAAEPYLCAGSPEVLNGGVIAAHAVCTAAADAYRLAGREIGTVGDTIPEGWREFEVAFSHEVIYLIHELAAHARAMYQALAAGGSYYASIGVHADSPLLEAWHREHVNELKLPRLYSVDEVMSVFSDLGFECAAARLQIGFVPAARPEVGLTARLMEWLDYNYERKLLLRFTRPTDYSHGSH